MTIEAALRTQANGAWVVPTKNHRKSDRWRSIGYTLGVSVRYKSRYRARELLSQWLPIQGEPRGMFPADRPCMHKSFFHRWQGAVRSSFLFVSLIAFASAPALAMMGGGGGPGGGQHMNMKGITGNGTGTGQISCSNGTCTETASGAFRGTGLGNGSFSLTMSYSDSNPIANGSGGACYAASGTVTLTAANGSAIVLADAGLWCATGADPAPITHNGAYIIQSASGRFSNSNGTGSCILAIDGSQNVYLNLTGGMGSGRHMGGGM